MDVGIFMASGRRLMAWVTIPPLLMVSVGMGSHVWNQRAQWQLEETKTLSEVLPSFIVAKESVTELFEGFGSVDVGGLGSEDQLISFLQDMAQQNDFMVDSVSVIKSKSQQKKAVPTLNAVVLGKGDGTAIPLYMNRVKTEQRLLSVSSIKISQPLEGFLGGLYEVELVFELLQLDGMKAFNGGIQ